VELISRPFRKNRDVSVTTPKILDARSTGDEFVIIPMVYDAASVVGELKSLFMSVCVCVCARASARVCVCVRERQRERERESICLAVSV